MQIILNQSEVEAAVQAYVDDQINLAGDINIVINADGTASVGINEDVSHNDDTPPLVEKKTRRSRKNPQEAKHRPVEPEPEEVVEEIKEEETQTSTGGPNGSSTPEPEEEAVAEPEAQEEVVQEEVKAEEPAEKPATKPSLFAGLKRS
ncbi:hypothetical protein psb1_0095 [Shigella phage pSb-1]|uniref:Uncharacterized protein n=1 Tax=Shigella phage pSb-1 TaxID=1414738 RepID=V5UQM3_9CAUD|nr:hypothetical protein psb1_0095 [Shigella phage pSb-1]AHB79513.1 hypothetical protein psb1_0095 [Shigella phage pSb-1]